MGRYLLRRSILLLPTLFIISVAAFLVIRLAPIGLIVTGGREVIDALSGFLGLDRPIHVAYWEWLLGLFTNGLGKSLWTSRLLSAELARRLPVTLELSLLSLLVAQVIAVPLGLLPVLRHNRVLASVGRGLGVLFSSIPVFVPPMLLLVFAVGFPDAPMRWITFGADPIGHLRQFVPSALLIGLVVSGGVIRMLRVTTTQVLSADYLRTARAKGLREQVVLLRHGVRNAVAPALVYLAAQVPVVISLAVIVEGEWGLPGIGRLFLDSQYRRDFPFISGLVLVSGITGMLAYFVADVLRAWLDPQVRYETDPVGWEFEG